MPEYVSKSNSLQIQGQTFAAFFFILMHMVEAQSNHKGKQGNGSSSME